MDPAPRTKTLFVILFGIPLLLAALGAGVVWAICRQGTLEFSMHGKAGGAHVGVQVPAILVPIALHMASAFPPAECLRHNLKGNEHFEVVREMLAALEDAPDGILVDVRTREELVLIEKRAGRLLVSIDTPDENVQASMPLRAARSAFGVI